MGSTSIDLSELSANHTEEGRMGPAMQPREDGDMQKQHPQLHTTPGTGGSRVLNGHGLCMDSERKQTCREEPGMQKTVVPVTLGTEDRSPQEDVKQGIGTICLHHRNSSETQKSLKMGKSFWSLLQ